MRRYALIGRRLGHSFSKRYFTEKFQRENIDAMYELMELDDIASIRDVISADDTLFGLNVTIPYKERVIPYLDAIDECAAAVGAVNCISISGGRTIGHNTDVIGISRTFSQLNVKDVSRAIVLGTGGAAKAVSYVLRQQKIPYVIISRDMQRGDYTYDTLPRSVIADSHLIINTTPLGMYPDISSAPAIDYSAIGAQHRIFDLIYNPPTTLFLQRCADQGAVVIGGELMLKVQAEASWALWSSDNK